MKTANHITITMNRCSQSGGFSAALGAVVHEEGATVLRSNSVTFLEPK
jgi:hypothetical protein